MVFDPKKYLAEPESDAKTPGDQKSNPNFDPTAYLAGGNVGIIDKVLRPAEFAARGFGDAIIGGVGSVLDLSNTVSRAIGLPTKSKPGEYTDTMRRAYDAAGKFISSPINKALGYRDAQGQTTNVGGPAQPIGLERYAYGAGRGAGDAATFLIPATGAAKVAQATRAVTGAPSTITGNVVRSLAAQPKTQIAAGSVGGVVTEATENPYLGMLAALGTGVGGSVAVNRFSTEGAKSISDKKILNLVRQLGDGNVDRGMKIARQRMADGGEDTALVDVLGIKGEKYARAAANVPEGRGPEIADEFIASRVSGRGRRLQTAADRIAPNSFMDDIDALNVKKRSESAPLYEEAFAPRSDLLGRVFAPWDARLQQFLDDPLVRQGMNKGVRTQQLESLATGKPLALEEFAVKGFDESGEIIIEGTPTLRLMDAAKRGIDEILGETRNPITGKIPKTDRNRVISSVSSALVKKLDEISTDQSGRSAYKEARAAFAGPSKLIDAGYMGRNFAKGDEEITESVIAGMTKDEKAAFRLGARREISSIINKDTQTALTKFNDKKQEFWNKLRPLFPDDLSFSAFKDDIANEIKKGNVERFVGPRSNSQTASLSQDMSELGRQIPESAARGLEVLGHLSALNLPRAAMTIARPAYQYFSRPNAKVAEDMVTTLLERSPKVQDQIMQKLLAKPTRTPIDLEMLKALGVSISGAQAQSAPRDSLQMEIRPPAGTR